MVEEYSPHIVQMAVQSEKTPTALITPHLDLVVVASGNEQGLRWMKVDTSNGAVMLLEAVDESSHAIVP